MASHQTSVLTVLPVHRFSIRPLVPDDRERFARLFARLSAESRRRRFLTPKLELGERELTYLTDVDHVEHVALAAVDACDGTLVGVARYVRWAGRPGVADFAIEVADDLHRSGIGLMLAQALIIRARENQLAVLSATTLSENRAARALARRVGFRAQRRCGAEIELELELCLPRDPEGIDAGIPAGAGFCRREGSRGRCGLRCHRKSSDVRCWWPSQTARDSAPTQREPLRELRPIAHSE